MIWWLRWIHSWIVALFGKVIHDIRNEKSTIWFRCWPFDCDEYFHLNNAQYLVFTEMGRRNLFFRYFKGMKDEKLRNQLRRVVAAGHYIRYRLPIAPFQSFCVETRIVATRGRSFWFEQFFKDTRGVVLCHAICRTTLLDRDAEAYRVFGLDNELPLARHIERHSEIDDLSSAMLKTDKKRK